MKHTIIITFDRDNNSHNVEMEGASGREVLLAIQSLTKFAEEKAGLPIEICMMMASMEQEKINREKADKAAQDICDEVNGEPEKE